MTSSLKETQEPIFIQKSHDDMAWFQSCTLVEYSYAQKWMHARAEAVAAQKVDEAVWLLEHPPLYTAGTGAKPDELLSDALPVHRIGRGGKYTYHGPGQRVAYVVRNLGARGEKDLRAYVQRLEQWGGAALASLGVCARPREGRIGLWVDTPQGEKKIAAIGVRVRRWVTTHGMAVNVNPDLSHFAGIVPCGITEYGVTSLADLGIDVTMSALDLALSSAWAKGFPPLESKPASYI